MAGRTNEGGVPRHQRADEVITEFLQAKRRLELGLARCSGEGDSSALDGLQGELQAIQQKVTDAAGYLPSANLRWLQQELKGLKAALGKTQGQVKPRSRFAFKDKKETPKVTAEVEVPCSGSNNVETTKANVSNAICDPNAIGFRDRSNEELELVDTAGKNVELASLSRCRVTIKGSPAMLFVHKVVSCELRCGPVTTSVFVEDSRDCKFWLACQQLRVHGTEDSVFRVHVSSRTIIEDSKRVQIGEYDWKYEGDEADWSTSGLERDRNNWKAVDDFNWLSVDKPSPNWSVLQ